MTNSQHRNIRKMKKKTHKQLKELKKARQGLKEGGTMEGRRGCGDLKEKPVGSLSNRADQA